MNREKVTTVILWTIRVLAALVFIVAGSRKLMGGAGVMEMFQHWGFPDKFYYFIGGVETLGGIGLLIPKWTAYAAILLLGNMIGAIITHLTHGEAQRLPLPAALLILLAVVAYAKRPAFLRRKEIPANQN
ncbi:MAG: DoxX family protein [candidate division Zixibacteria bacterium]|nr:DoxX family protein [candidate division Zixibacteria bacterium]